VTKGKTPEDILAIANWLRNEMNIRLTPQILLVLASRMDATKGLVRKYAPAIVKRPDEVKTCLLAHRFFFGFKSLSNGLNMGLGDAVSKFGERGLMKYDSDDFPKWKDVLCWIHRKAGWPLKPEVAKYFIKGEVSDAAKTPVIAARKALAKCKAFDSMAKKLAKDSFVNWEVLLSQFGSDKKAVWSFLVDEGLVGYMACLAKGTPVWMKDGTTLPIEDVVAMKTDVLSYSQEWDARPVKYGPNQPKRKLEIGTLTDACPDGWLDNGVRPVCRIVFQSGREIEATQDHRWITRRRSGIQSWEWKTTDTLKVGDQIPMPLTAGFWGDVGTKEDGYFVGAMLGDGSMVSCTPDFSADDSSSGMVDVLSRFVEGKGGRVTIKCRLPHFTRYRFTGTKHKENPIIDLLRKYQVWGLRCENKRLPNHPFSREFWTGCLAGLIDTDGCVRIRKNKKGYTNVSMEYASVSEVLARQVSDALLKMGIQNIIRCKKPTGFGKAGLCYLPVWVVEVNAAQSVVLLSKTIQLNVGKKASRLLEARRLLSSVKGKKCGISDNHAYSADVVMDRVKSIESAGEKRTYCVTVNPSGLFIANGLVTGNCLRNLRNILEARVGQEVIQKVSDKISSKDEVLKSKQLPFRFLSALRSLEGMNGGNYDIADLNELSAAVELASNEACANIPVLPGMTAIFADNSGSMASNKVSEKSTVTCKDASNIMCGIVAKVAERPYVVAFGTDVGVVKFTQNDTVLGIARKVEHTNIGGCNTNGHRCVEWLMAQKLTPDRVIFLSDMQMWNSGGLGQEGCLADAWAKYLHQGGKAKETWLHSVHVNGYGDSVVDEGGRVNQVAGFNEKVFTMLAAVEGIGGTASLPTMDQIREKWTVK